MGEPVEQGCCQMFFSHHGIPISKFEVGGNDHGTSFVEGRAELEEQMSPFTAERNEAKFVQDQQIVLTDGSHEARELQVLLGTDQIID